jgi:hypothetical protein
MTVKLHGRTFEVQGTWIGKLDTPTFEPHSIKLEGREILNLIFNSTLYFQIIEKAVNQ